MASDLLRVQVKLCVHLHIITLQAVNGCISRWCVCVSDVLVGKKEQDHLPNLIPYGDYVQQTPEWGS